MKVIFLSVCVCVCAAAAMLWQLVLTWVGEVVHQYDAIDLLVENRTKLLIFLLPTDIPKLNKKLVLHLANTTNTHS
jgi:uncharacterized protein YsxB (DUF464 family)